MNIKDKSELLALKQTLENDEDINLYIKTINGGKKFEVLTKIIEALQNEK